MSTLRSLTCALIALLVLAASASASANTPTSISASEGHTCASMLDGSVDCFGNFYPQALKTQWPTPIPGISRAVSVSSGVRYNCALLAGGTVDCWGDDGFGQLGNGANTDTAVPVHVLGIANAVAISTGGFHACALLSGGQVKCWGHNLEGALGDGSGNDSSVPVLVRGITSAVSISAGYDEDETCAVLAGGTVDCWGSGEYGQLGNGVAGDSATPVPVKGITNAVAVAAGGLHSCAVLASGAVECWGQNELGELGNGSRRDSAVPVPVRGLPGPATAVAVAARAYSCALLAAGTVYCWGGNPRNQLGNNHLSFASAVPVKVAGVTGALSISTGTVHACALLTGGVADCWGSDDYGQLGNGPRLGGILGAGPVIFPSTPTPTPTPTLSVASATAVDSPRPLLRRSHVRLQRQENR